MPENSLFHHPANADRLFRASCVALIVTAMSFAIRGEIMGRLGEEFTLSGAELGWVASAAFWGFTLSMVFGGPLCDVVGMGRLAGLAFVGHVSGIVLTIFASGFWTLFAATLLVGLGNGLVEAACNPLIATIYPENKTKMLNLFHVWFPGGIVIGGVGAYLLNEAGFGWQVKMAIMLLPAAIYGAMFFGQKFPQTERVQSGVSTGEMFSASVSPLFIFMIVCMFMTAATELGTGQWLPVLLENVGVPAILVLVWINGLMAVGRQFAGPVVHTLSPTGMLLASAVISAFGLYWLSFAQGSVAFAAAAVFAVGICYFWPTMLGFVAENIPRSGALGLAIMGGAGNLSVTFILPLIGDIYDSNVAKSLPAGADLEALRSAAVGTAEAGQWMAAQLEGGRLTLRGIVILPMILVAAFLALYYNRRGKQPERLERVAARTAE